MKKILIGIALSGIAAVPAIAADMPVKAPPLVAAAYSWTGCYIGGNVGYVRQTSHTRLTGTDTDGGGFGAELADGSTPSDWRVRNSGVLGGGQVGCNWQNGRFVWGIEGDIDGAGASRTLSQTNLPQPPFPGRSAITTTVTNKLDWMSTIRGRVGITLTDRWLAYLTGGIAFGETEVGISSVCPTCGPARNLSIASRQTGVGGVFGWGSEYAFNNNWSMKTETLFFDLGRNSTPALTYAYGASTSTVVASNRERGWTMRMGLNYRWGGPVVARY